MNKSIILMLMIIIASFVIAIYSYSIMPDEMASHWDSQGQVNGYMSKFWGVFLMPIVSLGILILFLFIPRIDPLKKNIEEFRQYFDGFIVIILLFLLYIYILTLLWNIGIMIDIGFYMLPALGFLLFYAGILMENAKMNWFIGIRTPWTLSNETVWKKTHQLGSKIFKAIGIIIIISMIAPNQSIMIVLAALLLGTAYIFLYSYLEYKKIKK